MQISETARQLKRLRLRAGIGVREIAKILDLSPSRYQYYETRFKKAYLDPGFVQALAPHLVGKGSPPVKIEELAALYGTALMSGSPASRERDETEVEQALDAPTGAQIRSHMPKDVPVLGTATGGSDADFTIMNGDAVDWVRRPPRIMGRKDVFALWVKSNSMAKWRSSGDLVYCEAVRGPKNGDYVVLEMHPDKEDAYHPAFLKKLVSQGGNYYTVEQYNPPKTFTIPKKNVRNIFRVIDWAELLSV